MESNIAGIKKINILKRPSTTSNSRLLVLKNARNTLITEYVDRKQTRPLNPKIHLRIETDILNGCCKHWENMKPHPCDCKNLTPSPRSQRLVQHGLASISYGAVDLSFVF